MRSGLSDSLETRKMPRPCALPVGFAIHVESGLFRNSSTKMA